MNLAPDEADRKLLALKQQFVDFMAPSYYRSISHQQAQTTVDRPAKGSVWASRSTFPRPADDAHVDALLDAIRDLGNGMERHKWLTLADVKVQWTGFRAGVDKNEPEPVTDEDAKYRNLLVDSTSKITIMYFHGGFY